MMYVITAPYFVAGVITRNNVIEITAPILHWSKGKTVDQLSIYCKAKKWSIDCVDENDYGADR